MSITPLSGSESTETGEVWGDFSGGQIVIAITHPAYVSSHIIRVGAFDGSGNFVSPPSGTTANLQNEADNLVTLIRAIYASDSSVAAVAVNQTLSDHTGVAPFAFNFATTHFGAGTATGASLPTPSVINFNSRGADGSKWRLTLPGVANSIASGAPSKTLWPSVPSGVLQDLIKYLSGQTNGPVSALKTNVQTHNGVAIAASPGSLTETVNKRLRRHFKIV